MPNQKQLRERQPVKKTDARAWAEQKNRGFESTLYNLPEGRKLWKPEKDGIYKLDVIPYIVGEGNRHADEGMQHFELTISVHGGLGLQGFSKALCNAYTFKQRDYFCDWVTENGGKADQEFVKKLRNVQDRILMNVVDITDIKNVDTNPPIGSILLLDQPFGTSKHPSFGEVLKQKIQAIPDFAEFSDLQGGYTLVCTVKEDCLPGGKPFKKITNIEMVKRKYDYEDDVIDKAMCLESLLIRHSYEEQKKLLHEPDLNPKDKPVENDKPEISNKSPKTDKAPEPASDKEPEEKTAQELGLKLGMMVEYEGEICKITRISGDGKTLTLEDPDEEALKGVNPNQVTVVPNDNEPQGQGRAAEEEDEDEPEDPSDLEEDEDEDEPQRPQKRGNK